MSLVLFDDHKLHQQHLHLHTSALHVRSAVICTVWTLLLQQQHTSEHQKHCICHVSPASQMLHFQLQDLRSAGLAAASDGLVWRIERHNILSANSFQMFTLWYCVQDLRFGRPAAAS